MELNKQPIIQEKAFSNLIAFSVLIISFIFSQQSLGAYGKILDSNTELPRSTFKTVKWTDLLPKADLQALLNPPEYLSEIEDGSEEDRIDSTLSSQLDKDATQKNDPYHKALVSVDVVPEMNGKQIRIPGFIVPLEFDDNEVITQFFLVPFFGACIHVPPPPPNQIILVNYPKGIKLDTIYDPFYISGTVKTELIENDVAKSSYTLNMQIFEEYREDKE